MEALEKARDDAFKDFKRHPGTEAGFHAFHDFESINDQLGDESRTVSAFVKVDSEDPATAERLFHIARPALTRAKEYRLCGKYLEPDENWLSAAQLYHFMDRETQPEVREYAEKSFTNEVATLLALLVVNGRKTEAERISQKALLELDSPAFKSAIDSAMGGVVPDPWP